MRCRKFWGYGKCNKQFRLFSQCFLPYMALTFHFKMSSAICFNLDPSKSLSSGNGLKKIKICVLKGRKHCWERKKCWLPVHAFSHFTTMFSKAFFLRVVKSWDYGKRVKQTTTLSKLKPFVMKN